MKGYLKSIAMAMGALGMMLSTSVSHAQNNVEYGLILGFTDGGSSVTASENKGLKVHAVPNASGINQYYLTFPNVTIDNKASNIKLMFQYTDERGSPYVQAIKLFEECALDLNDSDLEAGKANIACKFTSSGSTATKSGDSATFTTTDPTR